MTYLKILVFFSSLKVIKVILTERRQKKSVVFHRNSTVDHDPFLRTSVGAEDVSQWQTQT